MFWFKNKEMKELSKVLHYYLPYKLHCICHTNYKGGIDIDQEVIAIGESYITYRNTCFQCINLSFSQIKPILHPLSSLTTEYFTDWNLDIIDQISIREVRDGFKLPEELTFRQASLCFEKHLDIFSLIESGQAIEKTI